MRKSRLSTITFLACFVLLLSFIAGCGGTEEGSGDQNGGNGSGSGDAAQAEGGTSREQDGVAGQGGETAGRTLVSDLEVRVALGEILSVDAESRTLVLRPVEGERQVFRVVPNANVELNDNPAELATLEQGQEAQVRYVVRNGRDRARAVDAFSPGGSTG